MEYVSELSWSLKDGELAPGKYNANHRMRFSGGLEATMTPAPDYGGDPRYVNPEEALAASLSSCHMMTFLALAAKAKWKVTTYRDRAVAVIDKNEQGRMWVSGITLNPVTEFEPGHEIDHDKLEEMHERAHRYCFVANSLKCNMKIVV